MRYFYTRMLRSWWSYLLCLLSWATLLVRCIWLYLRHQAEFLSLHCWKIKSTFLSAAGQYIRPSSEENSFFLSVWGVAEFISYEVFSRPPMDFHPCCLLHVFIVFTLTKLINSLYPKLLSFTNTLFLFLLYGRIKNLVNETARTMSMWHRTLLRIAINWFLCLRMIVIVVIFQIKNGPELRKILR